MWTLITPYRSVIHYGDEVVTRMYGEHEEIVAALEARDQHAYEQSVEAHQRHIYEAVGELADREARASG